MRRDYHSAHYPEQPARRRYAHSSEYGVALAHDVAAGPLPSFYQACDVFYTDPPWRSGNVRFFDRAGVKPRPHESLMRELVAAVPDDAPAVFVIGKHADSHFGESFARYPVRLNEHDAVAYSRGVDLSGCATAEEVGRLLAGRYARVGDPCCGYGNTAKWFVQAGKQYVVSDINPRCIGYIAEHESEWLNVLPE